MNLFALGVFLALLGVRKVSVSAERIRAGLNAKMAGANLLGVAALMTALVDTAPGAWSALAAGLVFVFAGPGVALMRRGWKYHAAPATHVLAEDLRPPVVYIRSFQDDAKLLGPRWQNWMRFLLPTSFEQDLASIMNRVGPFVAVGRPGEPLPELGAARFYFSDDEWRARVSELMERARLVTIRSGATANLWWEIDQAITRLPPARLVLILHGQDEQTRSFEDKVAERVGWPGSIASVQPAPLSKLERLVRLGGTHYHAKLIHFGPDWQPRVEFIRPQLRPRYFLRMHRPLGAPLELAFDQVLPQLGIPLWRPGPSRLTAAGMAVLLGAFGAHHFYLGNKRRGVYHLLFCWTAVPLFVSWFDAAELLLMEESDFRGMIAGAPTSGAVGRVRGEAEQS